MKKDRFLLWKLEGEAFTGEADLRMQGLQYIFNDRTSYFSITLFIRFTFA